MNPRLWIAANCEWLFLSMFPVIGWRPIQNGASHTLELKWEKIMIITTDLLWFDLTLLHCQKINTSTGIWLLQIDAWLPWRYRWIWHFVFLRAASLPASFHAHIKQVRIYLPSACTHQHTLHSATMCTFHRPAKQLKWIYHSRSTTAMGCTSCDLFEYCLF